MPARNVSFLQDLLNTVAEQGRALLPSRLFGSEVEEDIEELAKAVMSGRGEASGVAIARELLHCYKRLGPEERRAFFRYLAEALQPDQARVAEACAAYLADPSQATVMAVQHAVASVRQEFFRRLNLPPGATGTIVSMRRDLLRLPKGEPSLEAVDDDLMQLLQSWFNRGFLVLRRIDWQTPAAVLEKIIAYEAVHQIQGWDDLRRRLDPDDRCCFAFFHPSLVDEPLIFVEVALMDEMPQAIGPLLNEERKNGEEIEPTTAVFYSISNCQEGLRGISFGNFLIKHVVEELAKDHPSLKTFVTLSPAPHFARWLDRQLADDSLGLVTEADRLAIKMLRDPGWLDQSSEPLKASLMALAAHYFLTAKSADGRPVDPVARFHLGNGARLERINWLGDVSEKGLREAHGLMVNYRYDLKEIERNHEAFANDGVIATSRAVRGLLRPLAKGKVVAGDPVTATPLATRLAKPVRDAAGS